MIRYNNRDSQLVTYVVPLANVGAGLTWSGLPLLLSKETDDFGNVFILFISSIIAGAVFTLLGGAIADRYKRKNFIVTFLAIDTLLTLSLAIWGTKDTLVLFYAVSFSSALIGSITGSAIIVWIKDILSQTSDSLPRSMATRGLWNVISKSLGFAAGPIVYSYLKFDALFIDAIFSIIPAISLVFVNDLVKKSAEPVKWHGGYSELLDSKFWTDERQLVLSLFAVTAAYTVPTVIISYGILLQRYGVGSIEASTFWGLASAGSIASHFGMTRRVSDFLSSFHRLFFGHVVIAVAFAGLWFASSPIIFAFFFILFTLANPLMANALDVEVYEKCDAAFRGRFNAVCFLADDLVGAAVLAVTKHLMDIGKADLFYLWSIPLMFLAILLVARSRQTLSKNASIQEVGIGHQ